MGYGIDTTNMCGLKEGECIEIVENKDDMICTKKKNGIIISLKQIPMLMIPLLCENKELQFLLPTQDVQFIFCAIEMGVIQ